MRSSKQRKRARWKSHSDSSGLLPVCTKKCRGDNQSSQQELAHIFNNCTQNTFNFQRETRHQEQSSATLMHEGQVGKDEGARCFPAPADRAATTCSSPSITLKLLKMCSTPSHPQSGAAVTGQAVPWQGDGVQMPPQEPRDDCRPSHSLQQLQSPWGLPLNNR